MHTNEQTKKMSFVAVPVSYKNTGNHAAYSTGTSKNRKYILYNTLK